MRRSSSSPGADGERHDHLTGSAFSVGCFVPSGSRRCWLRGEGHLGGAAGQLAHAAGKLRHDGVGARIGGADRVDHDLLCSGRDPLRQQLGHVLAGSQAAGAVQGKAGLGGSAFQCGGDIDALVVSLSEQQGHHHGFAHALRGELAGRGPQRWGGEF